MSQNNASSVFLAAGVGGALGALSTHQAQMKIAEQVYASLAQLDVKVETLIEMEKARTRVIEEAARRAMNEREFQRESLWLSHCRNRERFDFLLRKYGEVLADELAHALLVSMLMEPEIARVAKNYDELRGRRAALREKAKACHEQLVDFRGQRHSLPGLLTMALAGPLFMAFVTSSFESFGLGWLALAAGFWLWALCACNLQRPSSESGIPVEALCGSGKRGPTLDKCIEALQERGEQLHVKILETGKRVDEARESLRARLNDDWKMMEARMPGHAAHLWNVLGRLQERFPPRLRCELKMLPDELLMGPLMPVLWQRYSDAVSTYVLT